MPSTLVSRALDDVRRSIDLSVDELWLACYALGSWLSVDELQVVLVGDEEPSAREFTITAIALNEAADEVGSELRVPSWTVVSGVDSSH